MGEYSGFFCHKHKLSTFNIVNHYDHHDHHDHHHNVNQDHQVEFKCSSSPSNPAAELKWETYEADFLNKRTARIEVNDIDHTSLLCCTEMNTMSL